MTKAAVVPTLASDATAPRIGAVGTAHPPHFADQQTLIGLFEKAWAEAFVMKEMSTIHSSHRADMHLSEWLKRQNVVAIDD